MKIPVDSLVNHTVLSAPVNHQKDATVHFNFHLSGDESPEQSRRIANAVLALGGLLKPSKSVGELTLDLKVDTSQAVEAIRDLADRAEGFTTENALAHTVKHLHERASAAGVSNVEVPFTGGTLGYSVRGSEPPLTEDDLPLNAPPYVGPEQFAGALTSDEIRVVESLPPAPPVPTPSAAGLTNEDVTAITGNAIPTTGKNGLPWDERIHSSSRAINADGTWRYRKNVPDETKQAVEAELKTLMIGLPAEVLADDVVAAPAIPVPPIPTAAPTVPVSTAQRSYSDVVNLIMANQATLNKPELYVAVLGMSLPEFAAACIAKPELATVAFNALDEIRRS
jgi:hypothetical protein